jgi:hypothetical protein
MDLATKQVIPAFATNLSSKHAMSARELRALGIYLGIGGGARGTNAHGDVLTQLVDGTDLNALWDEFQTTVALQNSERQKLVDLLTFPVTRDVETVPQFGTEDFEEASEFGVPKGVRTAMTTFSLGYTFKWYDIAARFTWMFLADADSRQVESVHQTVLDADNRLVFNQVMKTLFNNSNLAATIRGQNYTVYKLYNADGTVPPPYKSNTFDGSHNHYLATGAATIDSGDLDDQIEHLRHHGYSPENGVQLYFLMNPQQTKTVRTFRVSTGASWDFIPSLSQPAMLLPVDLEIQGGRPPSTFRGMNVIGSYGNALVIEEDYVPAGYFVLVGSGGEAQLNNVVGVREHANAALRGMRLVKGPNPDYPLIDSYYQRGFGTGVRQRGAAVVSQVTTGGSYTTPAIYS